MSLENFLSDFSNHDSRSAKLYPFMQVLQKLISVVYQLLSTFAAVYDNSD